MGVYLQDGSYGGHAAWSEEAITAGVADGVIISPFFTPEAPRQATPSGSQLADRVRDAGGEVIFDATTHGALLPGVDNWRNYNTWDLWDGVRGDLSAPEQREEHLTRVFDDQDTLGAPRLVPTAPLDSPIGADADIALSLAEEGRTLDGSVWQSVAGRRGFWLSDDLDAYVGSLAQLRSPTWLLTIIWEVGDYPPNLSDAALTAAVCRTVDSLGRRSRVIVCHSDLFGLPAVAAGASDVGTGWHGKQRVCAPATYQRNDPDAVRRQAIWHTYEGLCGRLHHTVSDTLTRRDVARAQRLYTGTVGGNARAIRLHHLEVVRRLVERVDGHGRSRPDRIDELRTTYETAMREFQHLVTNYSRAFANESAAQVGRPYDGLREYAEAEDLWA